MWDEESESAVVDGVRVVMRERIDLIAAVEGGNVAAYESNESLGDPSDLAKLQECAERTGLHQTLEIQAD